MPAVPKTPAALPTPRAIGRALRILLGIFLLFSFAQLLRHTAAFLAPRAGWSVPGGNWWLAALFCLLALPVVIDSGFGRRWGAWSPAAYLLLLGAAALWDHAIDGILWARPVSMLALLLLLYVFAHLGISLVVAGVAATPG
jgi:hypothetical protein